MFAVQCAKKNVALVLDLDDRLPRNLTGDRARVRQILANLVGNSCKVGPGRVTRFHLLLKWPLILL
jgi:signal transduction histidine kinase